MIKSLFPRRLTEVLFAGNALPQMPGGSAAPETPNNQAGRICFPCKSVSAKIQIYGIYSGIERDPRASRERGIRAFQAVFGSGIFKSARVSLFSSGTSSAPLKFLGISANRRKSGRAPFETPALASFRKDSPSIGRMRRASSPSNSIVTQQESSCSLVIRSPTTAIWKDSRGSP